MAEGTGTDFGLSGMDQICIVAKHIARRGVADMQELYAVVEEEITPDRLSDQGRASLRFFVNRVAVQKGYMLPHDRENPGWRLTTKGRELAEANA